MATDRLDDPKLTHIIVSKLVPDRYKEMIRRTLKCVAYLCASGLRIDADHLPLSSQTSRSSHRDDRLDRGVRGKRRSDGRGRLQAVKEAMKDDTIA